MVKDTNDSEATRTYNDIAQAQLGERVTNLNRRQSDFESEVRSGFTQIENAVSGLANETRSSIAALSTTLNERNKPQWQAVGVALTFCIALGGLAYWPINSATTDLKAAVGSLNEKVVTKDDLEYRSKRGEEDRKRTDQNVADLRDKQVPRDELEHVWRMQDQITTLMQKQIDAQTQQLNELRTTVASMYSPRDALMDLRDRQDRIEKQLVQRPSN